MTYKAQARVQITTLDGENPAEAIHEDAGDGTALCGTPLRDFKGQPTKYTPRDPGIVTCRRCARSTRRN